MARRSWRRRLRGALTLVGFGSLVGGSVVGWTVAMQSQAASANQTTLPANSLPLHNATAGPAVGCPGTGAYWHFVLTPNNGDSSFASIVLNVDGETFAFTGFPPIIENSSQTDNVFVPVPSGHLVTGLETSGSYATYAGAAPSKFVLSGVCVGDGQGDPPTTSTTDPSSTTTTTSHPPSTTSTTDPVTTSTTDPPSTTTTTWHPPSTTSTTDPVTTSTTDPPSTPSPTPGCTGTSTACDPPPTTGDPTTVGVVSPVVVQPEAGATSSSPNDAPAVLASTGASTGRSAWIAAGLIAFGIMALALGARPVGLHSKR
jgi:hypothetical protein